MRIRRVTCPVTLVAVPPSAEVAAPREEPAPSSFAVQRPFAASRGRDTGPSGLRTVLHEETVHRTIQAMMPATARLQTGVGREPLTDGIDASRVPLGLRPLIPALVALAGVASRAATAGLASAVRREWARGLIMQPSRLGGAEARQRDAVAEQPQPLGVGSQGLHTWASARHQPLIAQTRRWPGANGQPSVELVTPEIVQRLASDGGSGAPLPDEHRLSMEAVIGTDLRGARIHTGDAAARTAEALEAEAFAIGSDVFFGQGRYDPTSVRGRALLAHELVHVRQQTTLGTRRILSYSGEADAAEAEAQAVERAILDAAQPTASRGLTVGSYVRNYTPTGGQGLSSADVTRLDAISLQAIEVCKQLLGAELSRAPAETIERLQVEVSLDLGSLSDDEAAHIWGRAMAEAIQSRRAAVS